METLVAPTEMGVGKFQLSIVWNNSIACPDEHPTLKALWPTSNFFASRFDAVRAGNIMLAQAQDIDGFTVIKHIASGGKYRTVATVAR